MSPEAPTPQPTPWSAAIAAPEAAPDSAPDLGLRDAVHYPAGRAYFQSHSIGLEPRRAREQLAEAMLDPWGAARGDAWDGWLAALDRFAAALARLIAADSADICPQTNISSALTKILFALPERRGRRVIVLTEEDFPTVGHVLAQATRLGYRLEFLPGGPQLADPDAWARAYADDVQLVHLTHVYSNSATRPAVGEIIARARAAGAFTVLDIAQSAGAVPVALNAWRPDFATGTSVKYLCGGPGAAFLWADPDAAAASAPIDVGWFSSTTAFDLDIHAFDYAPGAKRFLGGTPSVAPFALATAGIEMLGGVGVERIFAHNQRLLTRLLNAMPAGAVLSNAAPGARGSAALIQPRDLKAAAAALLRAGVVHDVRAGGLRMSVHGYNTQSEIDHLIAALGPLV